MWKRNQSMVAQISQFDFIGRTIFLNPIRSFRNARVEIKNNIQTPWVPNIKLLPEKLEKNFWVYTPYRIFPFKNIFPFFKIIEERLFYRLVNLLNQHQPYIILINDPINAPVNIVESLLRKSYLSIFDFSDDFIEYFTDGDRRRAQCLHNIEYYTGAVDLVLTVNEHVKNKYGYLNSNTHILKNATNFSNFDRQLYRSVSKLEQLKSLGTPIVGCSGGIRKNRIDFDLLDYILKQKHNWQFIFVGDIDSSFKNRYGLCRNVHIFSSVDYQQLPNWLNYFDIAFIPFKCNEHTKGNDLLKIYDYLAMGLPVVSTRVAGAEALHDNIYTANSADDFINKLELALSDNSSINIDKRKSFAKMNSWAVRIIELEDILKRTLLH